MTQLKTDGEYDPVFLPFGTVCACTLRIGEITNGIVMSVWIVDTILCCENAIINLTNSFTFKPCISGGSASQMWVPQRVENLKHCSFKCLCITRNENVSYCLTLHFNWCLHFMRVPSISFAHAHAPIFTFRIKMKQMFLWQ